MSVNEVGGAVGDWEVKLSANTPKEVLDQIDYWGHIVISPGEADPERYGDNLLNSARYVGVLRGRSFAGDSKSVSGGGMALWLGDEDDKGHVFETPVSLTNASFNESIEALLPNAIDAGTLHNQTGLYTGVHQYQSSRKALDYVTELFDAEWRINGDGTLDAGKATELYNPEPTAAITSKIRQGGIDLDLRALPGDAELEADMDDFTTRVVLLAQGENQESIVSATADILPVKNPYRDIWGNPLERTRMVSESDTSEGNAQARAQLQLNRFTSPRESIKLSTVTHDISGDVLVGGYVWVEDVEAKLFDLNAQIRFRGMQLNPIKMRVTGLSWPIERGMGVAYRHWDGSWVDLTKYVEFESGATTVTVGGYSRSLTGTSAPSDPIGSVPVGDNTTPDKVLWNVDEIRQATYTSTDGSTRAQIDLAWFLPLNTDGTVITDGGRYQIRYRNSETAVFPATHEELSAYRHQNLLGTYRSPIKYDTGAWQYIEVPWGDLRGVLIDLTPGTPYDFEIRALDNSNPPHTGEWSDRIVVQIRPDRTPPSAPSKAEIAASKTAIQVVHRLGAAGASANFTLEADVNHLLLYSGTDPTFEINKTSIQEGGALIGKMPVGLGAIVGGIPIVQTFQVDEIGSRWYKVTAVDNAGNESLPSEAVQQTAELIDDAYISNLTVSKVTAGRISAFWVNANNISTAENGFLGQRVNFGFYGLEAFNNAGQLTFDLNSSDGSFYAAGTIESGKVGRRVRMSGETNDIIFYPESGETRVARIKSFIPSNYPNHIAIEMGAAQDDTNDVQAQFQTLPHLMFLNVSRAGQTDKPWSSMILGKDSSKIEMYDAFTGYTDGGYLYVNKDNIFLGMHKETPWVDAYATLGRIDSFQYFDLKLNPQGSASVPGMYISNHQGGRAHFGLRLSNGAFSSGFQYDGLNGIALIRASGDVRIRNPNDTGWITAYAATFSNQCNVDTKEDFKELPESAMDVLRNTPITLWKRKDDDKQEFRVGPIAESLPKWALGSTISSLGTSAVVDRPSEMVDDGLGNKREARGAPELIDPQGPYGTFDSVDMMTLASLAIEAIRELDEELDEFRAMVGSRKPKRVSSSQLIQDIRDGKIKRRS